MASQDEPAVADQPGAQLANQLGGDPGIEFHRAGRIKGNRTGGPSHPDWAGRADSVPRTLATQSSQIPWVNWAFERWPM